MKVASKAAILGQVSKETRNQGISAHIGIQQHKKPVATYNSTRLMFISFNELVTEPFSVLFCDHETTLC